MLRGCLYSVEWNSGTTTPTGARSVTTYTDYVWDRDIIAMAFSNLGKPVVFADQMTIELEQIQQDQRSVGSRFNPKLWSLKQNSHELQHRSYCVLLLLLLLLVLVLKSRGPQRKKSRTPCLEINGNQQKSTEINQEITRNHPMKSLAVGVDPSTFTNWFPEAGGTHGSYAAVNGFTKTDGVSRVANEKKFGCFVLSVSYFWHHACLAI